MFRVSFFEHSSSVWDWYGRRDEIDMNPPYQRKGGLWNKPEQQLLIDSILNGFDLPKFYLAAFTSGRDSLNLKRLPFAIIDGKQRFEAIFGYINGKFGLADNFAYFDRHDLDLSGMSYADLGKEHKDIAARFDKFSLTVMSVRTDDEAKINDLFVRLNSSKPLVGPEIRNAMRGEVPRTIRDLAQHSFFTEYVRFSTKRGQDQNTAGKLLLLEFTGEFVDTKRRQLDGLVEDFGRVGVLADKDDVDRAALRVSQILDDMTRVFSPGDELLATQGPVPLYYWLVRTYGPDSLREFLEAFIGDLKSNQHVANEDSSLADPELLTYDLANRSINDQGSMKRRFRILSDRWERFLSDR